MRLGGEIPHVSAPPPPAPLVMTSTNATDPLSGPAISGAPASITPPSPSQTARPTASSDTGSSCLDDIVDENGRVDMRLLMISLWKNRKDPRFTTELCERLFSLSLTKTTLDEVEFYLPQLAHMVIHLDKELPITAMEHFVMLVSQSSVHFALQFFWIIYATLDENRPKRSGNPQTYARCAQLLLALEQCFIYGSPNARQVSELLTRHSISKAEMDQILMADRRFFACQSSAMGETLPDDQPEGWLWKKGGGTSRLGRRNWKLRWCRIERRILLIFKNPKETNPRSAVLLDRAELHVMDNPRHPHYFEIEHKFSESKFCFAAKSEDELIRWIKNLQAASRAPGSPVAMNKMGPARALASMTHAMRSFVLSEPERLELVQGAAISLPQKKSDCVGAAEPTEQSSSQGSSSVDSEQKNNLAVDNLLGAEEVTLAPEQQRRYEFFHGFIYFIKSITDVSEELRLLEPAQRKVVLKSKLEKIQIPIKAYLPLCKSTDKYCNILSICTNEGRVFNTNERAPCLMHFETMEDPTGQDVSRLLFNYLYETNDESTEAELEAELHSMSSMCSRSQEVQSPFQKVLLLNEARKQKLESIFGELTFSKSDRVAQATGHVDDKQWRLKCLIAKSHDDLRQEVLVMQLISYFQHIFVHAELPLRLYPYRILATGASTGLIEVVTNATSFDGLKKTPGFKNLRAYFEDVYGVDSDEQTQDGAELLQQVELNFIHSLAAYSLVCYVLAIKDRHNGNIMLDIEGHLIHIDFGFLLGRAPGGSFSLETAPFKLTAEMVDAFGGKNSRHFAYFSDLCTKGALAIRRHGETILALVEVMSLHSKMPCFAGNTSAALHGLRDRLFLTMTEDKVEAAVLNMIEKSYDHFGTNKYDQFQEYSNGIAK